jgi:hypothetical protein
MEERIDRARQLLAEIHHIAISTVNADGSPHSSPLFMAFDDKLCAYWASRTGTQHSINIGRDPRIFMVVFDSRAGKGGLYIRARAEAIEGASDAADALRLLSSLKQRLGGTMGDLAMYTANSGQRLYKAVPETLWINSSEKDANGAIVRDSRCEISVDAVAAGL